MVSGCSPIRAKKARYYEDPKLNAHVAAAEARAFIVSDDGPTPKFAIRPA